MGVLDARARQREARAVDELRISEARFRSLVENSSGMLRLVNSEGITTFENLAMGALLHDIGKMAVPDSILLKKGKLGTEEGEIMKAHPEHAFKLLSPISFRPALDIPYAHHER